LRKNKTDSRLFVAFFILGDENRARVFVGVTHALPPPPGEKDEDFLVFLFTPDRFLASSFICFFYISLGACFGISHVLFRV